MSILILSRVIMPNESRNLRGKRQPPELSWYETHMLIYKTRIFPILLPSYMKISIHFKYSLCNVCNLSSMLCKLNYSFSTTYQTHKVISILVWLLRVSPELATSHVLILSAYSPSITIRAVLSSLDTVSTKFIQAHAMYFYQVHIPMSTCRVPLTRVLKWG